MASDVPGTDRDRLLSQLLVAHERLDAAAVPRHNDDETVVLGVDERIDWLARDRDEWRGSSEAGLAVINAAAAKSASSPRPMLHRPDMRNRWAPQLHGRRATVIVGGDAYRGTLRRTRVGWRMGDPTRVVGGAAWIASAMTAVDVEAPAELDGKRVAHDFTDVEFVPDLDAPTVAVPATGQVDLTVVCADAFGMSTSEGRRLMLQGAVRLDGLRVPMSMLVWSPQDLDGCIFSVGSRRAARIVVEAPKSASPAAARCLRAYVPAPAAAPHGQEETKPAEAFGTCDWGGCDHEAVDHRWTGEHGWLPVCRMHTLGCTCPNESSRVASCRRHGWHAQSEHAAEEAWRRLGAEMAAASRVRKETPDDLKAWVAWEASRGPLDGSFDLDSLRIFTNFNELEMWAYDPVAMQRCRRHYQRVDLPQPAPYPSLRELLTSAREALFDSLAAYPGPLASYEIGWDRDSGSYAVYDIPRDPSGASIGMTLVKSGFEGPQDAGRWIGLARVDVHLAAVAAALEPREEAS